MPLTGFQRTLSTLARTPNQSAAAVLEHAVEGRFAGVRSGAIGAFARRRDETSQRRFLRLFGRLRKHEIADLPELTRDFRTTFRNVLAEHDVEIAQAACHMVVSCRGFDEFPALVTAASDPRHPGADAVAVAVLELARALHEEISAYRRAPGGRDPSFARRWALTALAKAVERFHTHRRLEVLEAFLLVTTPGNATLAKVLTEPSHAAHKPLVELLRTSPSPGAIEVLAKLFEDTQAPLPLLELAVERTDNHFRALFLESIGYPASPRVLENAQRVRQFQLLEKPSSDWFALAAPLQATAAQLVAASRFSRRTKLSILDQILARAQPLARCAAAKALAASELRQSRQRLEHLLSDRDPQVVVIAAKALRRQGHPAAVQQLARLLDHNDPKVRRSARTALADFSFLRFVADFENLTPSERAELGRIVKRTDNSTIDELSRELNAATLARKLRALQMIVATDTIDELAQEIAKQADHPDAAVRLEAISALAMSTEPAAREAIEAATQDPNGLVRNKAAEVWARLAGAGVAAGGTR